jgi:hypothetical protein
MNSTVTISYFTNKHWVNNWIKTVLATQLPPSSNTIIDSTIVEEVATNAGYVVKDSTRQDIRFGSNGTGIFIWDDITIDIPEHDLILLKLKYE